MPSLLDRLLNVAIATDEVGNSIVGGKPRETLSGSIGRADAAGVWWAKPARAAVDAVFGHGHCARQAAKEATRRGT